MKKLDIALSMMSFALSILIISSCANNNEIIQLYPKNDSITTETHPTFKWIGKADKLVIDDNSDFISPITENIDANPYQVKSKLNFTAYYWKLIGNANSSVWQFRIDSVVALELKNDADFYNATNIGNTDLDVEVVEENRHGWEITGNVILRLNETKQFNLDNKTIIIGKQR